VQAVYNIQQDRSMRPILVDIVKRANRRRIELRWWRHWWRHTHLRPC